MGVFEWLQDAGQSYGRARAQDRISIEVRRQLVDPIYAGQPFRQVLPDLGLTPKQVWGLAKTDHEWSAALNGALMATCRDDLEHGTHVAYGQGASTGVSGASAAEDGQRIGSS